MAEYAVFFRGSTARMTARQLWEWAEYAYTTMTMWGKPDEVYVVAL